MFDLKSKFSKKTQLQCLKAGTIGAQSPKIDGDDSQWDNQHVEFGEVQEVLVNLLSMLAKASFNIHKKNPKLYHMRIQ